MTKPRAYSYVRFSTPEQMKGKSLERQTELATNWSRQHGIELDADLTLHDLGVSAFRGKNADVGALGEFLKAVHAGQVPRGSYLLVEAFDRITRECAYDAQLAVQNIVNAGITVVTLTDGKEYNVATLRSDPMTIVYAILMFARGHEESATKSKRIGDAWRRKRREIHQGKTLTAQVPGWIELDEKRKPRLNPRRAKLVQRMFQMFLSGTGKAGIADTFNKERQPTFRGGRYWLGTYVYKCLTNPAVCGDFQPHREDTTKRTRTRVPDGPPIAGYYPAVVDRRTFERVQKVIASQAGKRSVPVKGRTSIVNLLAGLAECPHCAGPVQRVTKAANKKPFYVCDRARHGAGCKYSSVRVDVIERSLIDNAGLLFDKVPETGEDSGKKIEELETAISACDTRIKDFAFLLDDTPSRTIAERIREEEEKRDQLRSALALLQQQIQQSGIKRMRENARTAKSALLWHKSDPSGVLSCNAALRECFRRIIIETTQRRLRLEWRHGPVIVLPYAS